VTQRIQVDGVPDFYVVFMTTRFRSFADVQQQAPHQLAQHVATSKRLHEQGRLLMAGAFLDHPDEPLRTMGVLASQEDARSYAENDPFVQAGLIEEWHIRQWANIFA
jgi:uncharacterized protein YciI